MKCPYCGNKKTKVIDSRSIEEGAAIRRRRHCLSCGRRFTTFERLPRVEVMVRKSDGTTLEAYDREKLATGFYRATSKRDVPADLIESSVDRIEEEIMKRRDREITSVEIGRMVMERLREIDEVAYIRFTSVYKRFDDISEFQRELGEFLPEQENSSTPGR
ncbi:MAG: transcriptional regulator NrdR [Actinobacteria bacterium]|nr:transcriptional regulator NrdR [Actinomycetota bacterium]MBU1942881.1 transcriptional regulator NrdR [Actinomycetota bacterium]MBU2687613.1 transcriptional regulator NrdR [Actinomycetota bacterium]